jgi:hypothetical protein
LQLDHLPQARSCWAPPSGPDYPRLHAHGKRTRHERRVVGRAGGACGPHSVGPRVGAPGCRCKKRVLAPASRCGISSGRSGASNPVVRTALFTEMIMWIVLWSSTGDHLSIC